MSTSTAETTPERLAAFAARRQINWPVLATVLIYGCVIIVSGRWLRQTSSTAAAYKAYHRAKVDFGLGRASLAEVCAASRRCCIAQCRLPAFSKSAPLQAHLARIEATEPAGSLFVSGTEKPQQNQAEVWQVFHDEALLWVQLKKPR